MPQPSHGDDTAIMTADGLHIPPYRPDDPDVVAELVARFGAELFTIQPTLTGMPVLWVPRERLIEVLTCLRQTDSIMHRGTGVLEYDLFTVPDNAQLYGGAADIQSDGVHQFSPFTTLSPITVQMGFSA